MVFCTPFAKKYYHYPPVHKCRQLYFSWWGKLPTSLLTKLFLGETIEHFWRGKVQFLSLPYKYRVNYYSFLIPISLKNFRVILNWPETSATGVSPFFGKTLGWEFIQNTRLSFCTHLNTFFLKVLTNWCTI